MDAAGVEFLLWMGGMAFVLSAYLVICFISEVKYCKKNNIKWSYKSSYTQIMESIEEIGEILSDRIKRISDIYIKMIGGNIESRVDPFKSYNGIENVHAKTGIYYLDKIKYSYCDINNEKLILFYQFYQKYYDKNIDIKSFQSKICNIHTKKNIYAH